MGIGLQAMQLSPCHAGSIGNTKPLFTRIPPPVPPRATGTTPRRTSRASGWPALDAAGRPPARAVGHGQDWWLVTGSLLGLLGGGTLVAMAGSCMLLLPTMPLMSAARVCK